MLVREYLNLSYTCSTVYDVDRWEYNKAKQYSYLILFFQSFNLFTLVLFCIYNFHNPLLCKNTLHLKLIRVICCYHVWLDLRRLWDSAWFIFWKMQSTKEGVTLKNWKRFCLYYQYPWKGQNVWYFHQNALASSTQYLTLGRNPRHHSDKYFPSFHGHRCFKEKEKGETKPKKNKRKKTL